MGMLGSPTGSSDAVVLRAWPSGETSVIASLLSCEHGYLRIIAKGARAGKSTLRPLVQPGRLVNAEYGLQPSRKLQYLKGGQLLIDVLMERSSLSRTAYILAAMELADRCRPGGDRDRAMFDLCRGFLHVLSSSLPEDDAFRFYQFEMCLLDLHGVTPELRVCVRCERDLGQDTRHLRFDPADGGLVCRSCHGPGRPLSPGALTYLRSSGVIDSERDCAQLCERALIREVGIHLHGFLAYHVPAYRLPSALDLLRTPGSSIGPSGAQEEPSR